MLEIIIIPCSVLLLFPGNTHLGSSNGDGRVKGYAHLHFWYLKVEEEQLDKKVETENQENRGPKKALEENIFKKGEEANCVDGHGEVT